ncbi:Histone RNA stem-loop-binding protein SLBP1/SLBP2 domain-containing protein [Rozella allomycis CSF55]|uniref:Histone RNA stem-loop-binding protein SLBP1/SLBP2 domain-containing protein n=1 Tax=Rozella allomycis (strain CSF55) TaxID=988480 RepID=A0A075AN24_ROZAC|nr:Histone RNA stem-loop-binding protein SLBP1/SLBP2 domain-containing protein [Rozella allomycis CSF55]|eukprot:EPZ31179.1 Histone RNA stem-loop-binding protein SLBP1/SLBP2 domain-containing protein [Rozella allomycis CSF55]
MVTTYDIKEEENLLLRSACIISLVYNFELAVCPRTIQNVFNACFVDSNCTSSRTSSKSSSKSMGQLGIFVNLAMSESPILKDNCPSSPLRMESPLEKTKKKPVVSNHPYKRERETDAHRLKQRQKQIDFGKNTKAYQNYVNLIPKKSRIRGVHPSTPDRTRKLSTRQWAGLVRAWRVKLHAFDPKEEESEEEPVFCLPSIDDQLKQIDEQKSSEDHLNVGDASFIVDEELLTEVHRWK